MKKVMTNVLLAILAGIFFSYFLKGLIGNPLIVGIVAAVLCFIGLSTFNGKH